MKGHSEVVSGVPYENLSGGFLQECSKRKMLFFLIFQEFISDSGDPCGNRSRVHFYDTYRSSIVPYENLEVPSVNSSGVPF